MKKTLLALLLLPAITLLSGCGSKAPVVKEVAETNFEVMERVNADVERLVAEADVMYGTGEALTSGIKAGLSGAIVTGTVASGATLTGDLLTGDIVTGTVITGELETGTVETNYTVSDKESYPAQPKHIKGNGYPENTAQLNAWAKSNMKKIKNEGYVDRLVIVTKKKIQEDKSIVLYISSGKWHCGGNIEMGYNAEHWKIEDKYIYTFDLENMDLRGTKCDGDRTKKVSYGEPKVGGYINTYNSNQIVSILFDS